MARKKIKKVKNTCQKCFRTTTASLKKLGLTTARLEPSGHPEVVERRGRSKGECTNGRCEDHGARGDSFGQGLLKDYIQSL